MNVRVFSYPQLMSISLKEMLTTHYKLINYSLFLEREL